MKYENTVEGVFLNRNNRFIARVLINDKEEIVHVPNTGRCKEILIPNTKIILQKTNNENRKTKYSLISAYKENNLINIDSQSPNKIAYEALLNKKILKNINITLIKKEKKFGNSRFDLYYEGIRNNNEVKGFIEVKGVTLEENKLAMFPDAPTIRGVKHIEELIFAKSIGYEANILFIIQMKGVKNFTPNYKMHKEFYDAIKKASINKVNILAYDSKVTRDEVVLDKPIDIII